MQPRPDSRVMIDNQEYELLGESTDDAANRLCIFRDAVGKIGLLTLHANDERTWVLFEVAPIRNGNGWANLSQRPAVTSDAGINIVLE